MKYDVIYSDRALNDLRNIHRYISMDLLAPEVAKKISSLIMSRVDSLNEMPTRCPLYDKEPWHSRGLRKLLIDNFIAFYLVSEEKGQVIVVTIMYSKRDITNILKEIL